MAIELGCVASMDNLIGPDIIAVRAPYDNGAMQIGRDRAETMLLPHPRVLVHVGFEVVRMVVVDEEGNPLPLQIEDHRFPRPRPPAPDRGSERYALDEPVDSFVYRRSKLHKDAWALDNDLAAVPKDPKILRIFGFRVANKGVEIQTDRARFAEQWRMESQS